MRDEADSNNGRDFMVVGAILQAPARRERSYWRRFGVGDIEERLTRSGGKGGGNRHYGERGALIRPLCVVIPFLQYIASPCNILT